MTRAPTVVVALISSFPPRVGGVLGFESTRFVIAAKAMGVVADTGRLPVAEAPCGNMSVLFSRLPGMGSPRGSRREGPSSVRLVLRTLACLGSGRKRGLRAPYGPGNYPPFIEVTSAATVGPVFLRRSRIPCRRGLVPSHATETATSAPYTHASRASAGFRAAKPADHHASRVLGVVDAELPVDRAAWHGAADGGRVREQMSRAGAELLT